MGRAGLVNRNKRNGGSIMRSRNCSNCEFGQWDCNCDVCVDCVGYDHWKAIQHERRLEAAIRLEETKEEN